MILHRMTPTLAHHHHHHQYLTENSVNNSDVIRRYRMLHLNESPLFILYCIDDQYYQFEKKMKKMTR